MSKKVLENLSEEETKKFEEMALKQPVQAIKELKNLTNCSLGEGKIWVDEKRTKHFVEIITPCPYCGKKLRTHLAKQCRFCLRDWHNENELKWLKSS